MKTVTFILLFSISFAAFGQKQEPNSDKKGIEKKLSPKDSMDLVVEKKLEETTKRTEHVEWKVFNFYVRLISKFSETKYDVDLNDRKYKNKYKDDFQVAKEVFTRYVQNQNDSNYTKAKAYRMLAWIAIEENDYDKAIDFLQQSERVVAYNCIVEYETERAKLKKMYEICKIGLDKKNKTKS
jgi:hypothetical protein